MKKIGSSLTTYNLPLTTDTIVAISTPLGEGGIGVVRLSGREAVAVTDRIFRSRRGASVREQKSFTAQVGHIVAGDSVVDEVLLLVMRAPKSYTCEDVVEISAHGGHAVLTAILQLVVKAGVRLAAPGEFTKRAFLNGRIDLLQAEAVLGLIQAKTELNRRWAASQLEGVLSRRVQTIKNDLVEVLSHLEAAIDFPDDLPETQSGKELAEKLAATAGGLEELLRTSRWGLAAKQGLKIAILGRPNVGKSSLLNRLSGSDRVIVTPYPGTTRDVVEETVDIRGFAVRVLDTAGIQDTDHPIEKEGMARSKKTAGMADLVLYVLDGSREFCKEDRDLMNEIREKKKIVVINKNDLPGRMDEGKVRDLAGEAPVVHSSCMDIKKGLQSLEDEIFRFISGGKQDIPEEMVISSVRQKELLEKAQISVRQAEKACREGLSAEFCASDVRLALNHLGSMVGEVLQDDVLDVLFSQFCIGK